MKKVDRKKQRSEDAIEYSQVYVSFHIGNRANPRLHWFDLNNPCQTREYVSEQTLKALYWEATATD